MARKNKKDEKLLFAFLATFLSIIGFVIAILAKKDDEYVMFYAKQSLVIFIIAAVFEIIDKAISLIPVIGKLINAILGVMIFALWLVSWIYSLQGKKKDVPVIGEYAKKIRF